MAQRPKPNGASKKLVNNFLDSLEVAQSLPNGQLRNSRGQKRNKSLLKSLKFENNEVSKSNQYNPFKPSDEPRGRNLINRSLCYDSHNSSIQCNPASMLNQSFEYPSAITINANSSYIYAPQSQVGKSQDQKKIQSTQQII